MTPYGAIKDVLNDKGVTQPTIQDVSDAVIQIRREKLPDPEVIGNAGSFFKNPTITYDRYVQLQNTYPKVPGYPIDNQYIKVPAGWLIEQCGWKGKRFNDIGVHSHQALVLVNYKNGSGEEILSLATRILESVKSKFDIELIPEVNII
jgi:UDP-N-acetylmuramate dehydrogenase